MSIDIFSLKAIENISIALLEWRKKLTNGINQVDASLVDDIPNGGAFEIKFAGYVAQQYIQKTRDGEKRAVAAYESIMKKIPKSIKTHFSDKLQINEGVNNYEIGTIPNLYSLIPMSQTAHKPIFALKAKDGVRGAHFNKVRDAADIYKEITDRLIYNIAEISA